jgi:hypothetical protein
MIRHPASKTPKVQDRSVLSPVEAEPVALRDVVPPATGRRDIVEPVENQVDESLYETFPASDPPSWTAASRRWPKAKPRRLSLAAPRALELSPTQHI